MFIPIHFQYRTSLLFFNKTTVLLLRCEESQYDIIIMDLCITIFFLRNYVFMSILIKDRRSKKKF